MPSPRWAPWGMESGVGMPSTCLLACLKVVLPPPSLLRHMRNRQLISVPLTPEANVKRMVADDSTVEARSSGVSFHDSRDCRRNGLEDG